MKGTNVADVIWASEAFIEAHGYTTPYNTAPEICVEVVSPSNASADIEEKIMLYLAKGAKEVWICDLDGHLSFYGNEGERAASVLAPGFPKRI